MADRFPQVISYRVIVYLKGLPCGLVVWNVGQLVPWITGTMPLLTWVDNWDHLVLLEWSTRTMPFLTWVDEHLYYLFNSKCLKKLQLFLGYLEFYCVD